MLTDSWGFSDFTVPQSESLYVNSSTKDVLLAVSGYRTAKGCMKFMFTCFTAVKINRRVQFFSVVERQIVSKPTNSV
jgi:hypothetical protein